MQRSFFYRCLCLSGQCCDLGGDRASDFFLQALLEQPADFVRNFGRKFPCSSLRSTRRSRNAITIGPAMRSRLYPMAAILRPTIIDVTATVIGESTENPSRCHPSAAGFLLLTCRLTGGKLVA